MSLTSLNLGWTIARPDPILEQARRDLYELESRDHLCVGPVACEHCRAVADLITVLGLWPTGVEGYSPEEIVNRWRHEEDSCEPEL